MKLFFVIATLAASAEKDPANSISLQKEKVHSLMASGILRSYSLSADFRTAYLVLEAESEVKVIQCLAAFPFISLMKSEITSLCFHRSHSSPLFQPSMN